MFPAFLTVTFTDHKLLLRGPLMALQVMLCSLMIFFGCYRVLSPSRHLFSLFKTGELCCAFGRGNKIKQPYGNYPGGEELGDSN